MYYHISSLLSYNRRRYICHHNYRGSLGGTIDGFEDVYFYGRKPAESMMANFRNFKKHEMDFVVGYMAFMGCYRTKGDEVAAIFLN